MKTNFSFTGYLTEKLCDEEKFEILNKVVKKLIHLALTLESGETVYSKIEKREYANEGQ